MGSRRWAASRRAHRRRDMWQTAKSDAPSSQRVGIADVSNGTWQGHARRNCARLTQVNDVAWSPDSTKIVFGHVNPSFPAQFVTAIVNGTPLQVSPTGSFTAPDAVWAPNNKIAFYGGGANFDVYTVNNDASGSFNVTQSAANESPRGGRRMEPRSYFRATRTERSRSGKHRTPEERRPRSRRTT